MRYFTICDEKNPGYWIIELICYCFLTNLGIQFLVHKLNYLIKNLSLIQYKAYVLFYPYLISEGDEIVRACDRHCDETVTLTKHVTKYKYMRKWMVEFLSKSQSRVTKIASCYLNSHDQIYQFTLISCVLFLAMTSSRVLVFWWGHLLIIPPWWISRLLICTVISIHSSMVIKWRKIENVIFN